MKQWLQAMRKKAETPPQKTTTTSKTKPPTVTTDKLLTKQLCWQNAITLISVQQTTICLTVVA